MARHRSIEIRRAILEHVFWGYHSPIVGVARQFGVTRQAIQLHAKSLVEDGYLVARGERRNRHYSLSRIFDKEYEFELKPNGKNEDHVWREAIVPALVNIPVNDEDICHYGVTEMVNNAIDHSDGNKLRVSVSLTHASIAIRIIDDGIGIFQKIASALGLSDPRLSLLELSKGKFTTAPAKHTGEGIFFTSRAFDRFQIRSSNLLFHHSARTDDWLVDVKDQSFVGTRISMSLLTPAERTLKSVFDRFSSGPDDHRFAKTHVPLELAMFGDESLVSRSSAKRVLARVEKFDEVLLDFVGIRLIGQAFADEIFRVFANEHPGVRIVPINANEAVTLMIKRAEAARNEGLQK